ncbi:unnamed protein product [Lampetra fluviatilis]
MQMSVQSPTNMIRSRRLLIRDLSAVALRSGSPAPPPPPRLSDERRVIREVTRHRRCASPESPHNGSNGNPFSKRSQATGAGWWRGHGANPPWLTRLMDYECARDPSPPTRAAGHRRGRVTREPPARPPLFISQRSAQRPSPTTKPVASPARSSALCSRRCPKFARHRLPAESRLEEATIDADTTANGRRI